MMCIESAFSIAKLLQLYEHKYELRRINVQAVGISCSAALLLIFASITRYQSDGGWTEMHLNACFRALDEFSASWDSAKSARELLLLVQRQWELRRRPARARRASPLDTAGDSPRKRTRTLNPDATLVGAHGPRMSALRQGIEQLRDQQGAIDVNMGLDLDWMVRTFPFAGPQDSTGT